MTANERLHVCLCFSAHGPNAQASTGYGVDQAGNGYGGDSQLTLEEAVDLAETEVQSIVSLVNVLYTDQVGANPFHVRWRINLS